MGCGAGAGIAAAQARNPAWTVTGIEKDPGLAARARTRCDRVLEGDLARGPAAAGRGGRTVRRARLRRRARAPRGSDRGPARRRAASPRRARASLVSVPNVGHLSVVRDLRPGPVRSGSGGPDGRRPPALVHARRPSRRRSRRPAGRPNAIESEPRRAGAGSPRAFLALARELAGRRPREPRDVPVGRPRRARGDGPHEDRLPARVDRALRRRARSSLLQAEALARRGHRVTVVSPEPAARLVSARARALRALRVPRLGGAARRRTSRVATFWTTVPAGPRGRARARSSTSARVTRARSPSTATRWRRDRARLPRCRRASSRSRRRWRRGLEALGFGPVDRRRAGLRRDGVLPRARAPGRPIRPSSSWSARSRSSSRASTSRSRGLAIWRAGGAGVSACAASPTSRAGTPSASSASPTSTTTGSPPERMPFAYRASDLFVGASRVGGGLRPAGARGPRLRRADAALRRAGPARDRRRRGRVLSRRRPARASRRRCPRCSTGEARASARGRRARRPRRALRRGRRGRAAGARLPRRARAGAS